ARAGSYSFQVLIADPGGQTATSAVSVTVGQTLSAIALSPPTATVAAGLPQSFSATASDQFGQPLTPQPAFTWSVAAGGAGGTITPAGLYTAPAAAGSDTVHATSGAVSGTAMVTITAATTGTTVAAAGGRGAGARGPPPR